MRVVATAGHVDHGKSTLIQALTGVDPDRWAIEKQRGMTIDLGFAATTLPSGAEIGFVDVPGHGRFVKNMLAGVGSVDACLFVVAATEGWKAQSEEHLRILELLGVAHGVIALTKVAVAGADLAELAAAEVSERVADTFLEGAVVVGVDAPAGVGIASLRDALDRLVSETPACSDRNRPRLWVDRSFAIKGSGTVVTGTLTGGSVSVGDEMSIEPGGQAVRIRTLESHNRRVETAGPGRRLAANLVGVGHKEVGRGKALVRVGQWHPTTRFDAALRVLGSLGHPVSRRGAYAIYAGSGEFPVALRVLGPAAIAPGETGLVRLWLREAVPLSPGDRYVLREAGRFETVGGGEVLDVDPQLPASKAAPSRSVDRVVGERGWVLPDELFRLTGETVAPTVGPWVADPDAVAEVERALVARCEAAGPEGVDLAALDDHARAVLTREAAAGGIEVHDDRVYASSHAPTGALSADAQRVLATLEAGAWAPPALPLSDRGALRELQRAGLAAESGDAWFATSAVLAAVSALGELLDEHGAFTVADARDRLDTSRKHVLPLLAHLDTSGYTSRRGDLRVAAKRLAALRRDNGPSSNRHTTAEA